MTTDSPLRAEYEAILNQRGFFIDDQSAVIQLSGKDRQSFLHNFCTADIKALKLGDSTEAFVLDPKGKTLFFVQVLCGDDSLLVLIPDQQLQGLEAHLSKYLIVEDVSIEVLNDSNLVYISWQFEGAYESHVGPGMFLSIDPPAEQIEKWEADGRAKISRDTFELIRVENRMPRSGVDVLDNCLAQEFERDATAISYTKGCYLGQETVARLDALGHTNRSFCLAECHSENPPDLGSELTCEGNKCGIATSKAWSPSNGSYLVLAMVKKPHHQPGKVLSLGEHSLVVQ